MKKIVQLNQQLSCMFTGKLAHNILSMIADGLGTDEQFFAHLLHYAEFPTMPSNLVMLNACT
jgi:hypothetical protein